MSNAIALPPPSTVPELALAKWVRSLFLTGEQGAWYDPSDMSTLFQDAAGTVPVTAVEQPVGLLLDKSKRLVLGPELVTNGDFSNGSTGWTQFGNSVQISGGVEVFTNSSAHGFYQTIGTMGRFYSITYTCVTHSAGTFCAAAGGNTVLARSSTGTFTDIILCGASGFIGVFSQSGFSGTIDNISVRELLGNHATQTTAASRPVLSARYNLFTETEFRNGVSDAIVRGGAITATTMTGYAGALAIGNDPAGSYAYKNGVAGGSVQTLSAIVEMADGNPPTFGIGEQSNTNTFCLVLNGAVIPPPTYLIETMGGGRFRVSGTFTAPLGAGNCGIVKYAANQPTRTFKVTAYQLTVTNSLPSNAYQRVNTSSDYDTVGFRPYLKFDGVDDFLVTPSINFTGTDKMTVFAGVRKLSDAAYQAIVELGPNSDAAGSSFNVGASASTGDGARRTWSFGSKGSGGLSLASAAIYASPITSTLTGIGDISGDLSKVRVNGVDAAQSTADQGAGSYSNNLIYIGRRGNGTLPFNGHLYQLIIRGAQSSDAQIRAAEAWVNNRTGAF